MHLVKGAVHHPGDYALKEHIAAEKPAHQVSDGAVLPERDQRTEVAITEGLDLLALKPSPELSDEMSRLLVRGLRARWDWVRRTFLRHRSTVPDGEHVAIARGL